MSDTKDNHQSETDLKFPQINSSQRNGTAGDMEQQASYEPRNKSQGPTQSFGKTPFVAKKERLE
jgi:hypothetical protein